MKTGMFKGLRWLMLTAVMTVLISLPAFATECKVTVKAPEKGSITLSGAGKMTTVSAGEADSFLTFTTTSGSIDITFTAEGISSEGDCYLWKRTANGSIPSQGKPGKYILSIPKGDESDWVVYAEDTHRLVSQPAIAVTAEKDGREAFYRCPACGSIYDLNKKKLTSYGEIPKIHNLKNVSQVDATCEKEGTKEYYTCTACSKLFSDSAGTKELAKPEAIPALGHDWDAGKVTKAATSSETGVLTYTCRRDKSHTKTETIPRIITNENTVQMEEDAITADMPEQTEFITDVLLDGSLGWKSDLPGATFSVLRVKGTAKKKGYIGLSWQKVDGAQKYIVYGKAYGKKNKFKKLYEGSAKKYTHRYLKSKKYYKYIVLAVNGKETVAVSTAVYVAPKGTTRGNVKAVSITPKKLSLAAGKKKILKAAFTKTGTVKTYRKIRFESGNVNVATVTSAGKVKAVGKPGDSTWIYAYAQNGVFSRLKVTVK